MKKVIEFLKWPLSIPMTILWLSYIYWILFYPMDFDGVYDDNFNAFLLGLGLLVIFCFFTTLLRLFQKKKIIIILVFIFYLITLGASTLYTFMYFPAIMETAEFEGFKYYEVATADADWHGLVLFYKCRKWSFDCNILYGSYGLTGTKIIIDEQQNEVSWFETGFHRLLITDGENFRGYTGLSTQLGKYGYQLSDRCNEYNNDYGYYRCASYTYTLYQCNLDYIACKPLPLQYTQSYDIYPYLVADEEKNEINLYENYEQENETLIFTYGEHSRCYVEGCEILEK